MAVSKSFGSAWIAAGSGSMRVTDLPWKSEGHCGNARTYTDRQSSWCSVFTWYVDSGHWPPQRDEHVICNLQSLGRAVVSALGPCAEFLRPSCCLLSLLIPSGSARMSSRRIERLVCALYVLCVLCCACREGSGHGRSRVLLKPNVARPKQWFLTRGSCLGACSRADESPASQDSTDHRCFPSRRSVALHGCVPCPLRASYTPWALFGRKALQHSHLSRRISASRCGALLLDCLNTRAAYWSPWGCASACRACTSLRTRELQVRFSP